MRPISLFKYKIAERYKFVTIKLLNNYDMKR